VRPEVHRELLLNVLVARRVERAGLLDRRAVVERAVEPAVQLLDPRPPRCRGWRR
jgi:hypothetical protein